MKRIIVPLTAILAALALELNSGAAVAVPETAPPPHYVIGLSPYLPKSVKDDVYRQIVGFVLEDMPIKSSVSFYDAYQLKNIARVDIPDVRAFRSGKTRANQFQGQIRKVRDFLASEAEQPANSKVKLEQAVRLPQFMDFVAGNLIATNQPTVVMILGSPLYLDPKEPGFSMVDGYFPSDGHLLASRDQSVYGVKGKAGALSDVAVHFGYFGDPWVSDVHQEKISRFWSLFLKSQGARLATFCGDLPTVFAAVRTGSALSRLQSPELDAAQTKVEMLRITRDVGMADWITRDVLTNIPRDPPNATVGPMKIGIRWKGNIDLDLYAASKPGGERLYFEHTRTSQGYYFKDHRSSPEREYEFIEFESPVDIWKVEAAINFYEGSVPSGPTGEIRIEFEGKVYTGRFSLPGSHGNKGREGERQSDYWTRIDVPAILKFPAARRSAARE